MSEGGSAPSDPIVLNSSLDTTNSSLNSYRADCLLEEAQFDEQIPMDVFYERCMSALNCLKTTEKASTADIQGLLEKQSRRNATNSKVVCSLYQ